LLRRNTAMSRYLNRYFLLATIRIKSVRAVTARAAANL
jgi:hypothetical protein